MQSRDKADADLVNHLGKLKMKLNFILPELNNRLSYVNHTAIE